jgi:type VI secretion system VasD/TssJ family lipoprotein
MIARERSRRSMERVVRLIAAASMVTVIGCSTIDEVSTDIGIKDPDFCVRLEATPRANFFEGQPHVVRLLIHPLTDTIGFEEASESSLIAGKAPKGKTGEPVELRVVPGEKRTLTRPLPPGTHWLGVVADY